MKIDIRPSKVALLLVVALALLVGMLTMSAAAEPAAMTRISYQAKATEATAPTITQTIITISTPPAATAKIVLPDRSKVEPAIVLRS